jgi:hypothetical protein
VRLLIFRKSDPPSTTEELTHGDVFDTIDGCFMNLAYDWAFVKPICDVAIFVTWVASLAIWRFGKIEQKRDARQAVPDGSAG